jgi:hypothetical protein
VEFLLDLTRDNHQPSRLDQPQCHGDGDQAG